MSITIIGTVFKKRGEYGDFDYMIKSGQYEDSLFIFNDDEYQNKLGKATYGNAIIRKYNKHALPNKPRSVGIVTGPRYHGYQQLDKITQDKIDICILEVKEIIETHNYTRVFYSAEEENGILGTSRFKVNKDVLEYITKEIKDLSNFLTSNWFYFFFKILTF